MDKYFNSTQRLFHLDEFSLPVCYTSQLPKLSSLSYSKIVLCLFVFQDL